MSVPVISSLVNVNKRSLYYLVKKYHLRPDPLFSDLSDEDLDAVVWNLLVRFPNAGW